MPPDQLGHDPVRDVVDGESGAVVALGRDPRVEHDLQQDVPQFLAQRLLVTGLQRLQGLVRLLEQVRRERGVGLPGIPRALHPQPVHGRDQVDEGAHRAGPPSPAISWAPGGTGGSAPGSGSHTTTASERKLERRAPSATR